MTKSLLVLYAELGLIGTIFRLFHTDPMNLNPGREKTNLLKLQSILSFSIKKLQFREVHFFKNHKTEVKEYISILSKDCIVTEDPAVMVAFCIAFLEHSPSKHHKDIYESLHNLMDYYAAKDPSYRLIFSDVDFNSIYEVLLSEEVNSYLC